MNNIASYGLIMLLAPLFVAQAKAQTSAMDSPAGLVLPLQGGYVLEGRTYERQHLIKAFLDAALSTHIPVSNDFPERGPFVAPLLPETPTYSFFRPERFKAEYPWLAEYLLREKGWPDYFALNKWAGDVRVAIGYPLDLDPFVVTLDDDGTPKQDFRLSPPTHGVSIDEKTETVLKEELSATLPLISNLTGLDISYLPKKDETKLRLGNIRIVFTDDVRGWRTPFKRGEINRTSSNAAWPKLLEFDKTVEPYLSTAVVFTPYSDKHVDGYFLTNHKNEIELAVCYVWLGRNETMLRGLIRECVIRALGFPDAIDIYPTHFLSLWNDPNAWRGWKHEQIPDQPPELSGIDQFLLRLLYNPAIRAGMRFDDLLGVLRDD